VKEELERMWKEAVRTSFKIIHSIHRVWIGKMKISLSQGKWPASEEWNPGLPKYKSLCEPLPVITSDMGLSNY
jgi:hypothetical protein